MDFVKVKARRDSTKYTWFIEPDFQVHPSKDILVKGSSFTAIWDEDAGLWSTNEFDVQRLVDKELYSKAQQIKEDNEEDRIIVKTMEDFSSGSWTKYLNYVKQMPTTSHELDSKVTFLNTEVKKSDYVSKRLPYDLVEGDMSSYEEMMNVLYAPTEREKFEWAIGAIISGDARKIQKFIVFYGESGAGKSTVIDIIELLFQGYYETFEAKELTEKSNQFATAQFKNNPLVAIQHDGDLSNIEDNSKLNSIISHEIMTINEKHKSQYSMRVNCFLFMGTNKPVRITDAKSGVIRRLIDVRPTGNLIPTELYFKLKGEIAHELGAIAYHCLEVYNKLGANYYSNYKPKSMMYKTDFFYNFVYDKMEIFESQDYISCADAYKIYKDYCLENAVDRRLPMYKFRENLKDYFDSFEDRYWNGIRVVRSCFVGFKKSKFDDEGMVSVIPEDKNDWLCFTDDLGVLDDILKDQPAQLANENGTPSTKWSSTKTTLKDIDTTKLHYVKVPENHIVIDFDIKNDKGEKDLDKNISAARELGLPETYGELSKSGRGIHLHYIFAGDVTRLRPVIKPGIECKVFVGNSSLRRVRHKSNNRQMTIISSGLPLKEEVKKTVNKETVYTEKSIRKFIEKNLRKEIHAYTKPSIEFIYSYLEDAYKSGVGYDVSDMRQPLMIFASKSTHNASYCLKKVASMKLSSKDTSIPEDAKGKLTFFDVESFCNLFVVCWAYDDSEQVYGLINPSPSELSIFTDTDISLKLVGFNCRRYDNHMMYKACTEVCTPEDLFKLSQSIINDGKGFYGSAYNFSYTDIYDFSTKKQSLKKWEIELGIKHHENHYDWTKPVPEDKWNEILEYCKDDVRATKAVFHHLKADWEARLILSEWAKMYSPYACPNSTTNSLTAAIIFRGEKHPQSVFNYPDLSETFPGYIFSNGKSYLNGEEINEGGYVYAEPGMYFNVKTFDVASMHPHSVIAMNLFGPYTNNFADIVNLRLMIKHKDYDGVSEFMDGIFKKYMDDPDLLKALSFALKIAINSVYGQTFASYDNEFRDPRNVDNVVAKRGALFMATLRKLVQSKGGKVIHIKTDSIKIEDPTKEIEEIIFNFGKSYGYTFEVESEYDRICLVNDAVYIAMGKDGHWDATGAQFKHPFVYKTMFSKEPIQFDDICEVRSVSTALYLDMNENLPEDQHDYQFVGKVGKFCPIIPGKGGGILLREKDGKMSAAPSSKGFRWLESEVVEDLKKEDCIDYGYFESLVEAARAAIEEYGDVDQFSSGEPMIPF